MRPTGLMGEPREEGEGLALTVLAGALAFVLLFVGGAFGQLPATRDVPKAALYEIGRRGAAIERVNGYQAGPEQAQFEAFAIPKDDSDKFRLSLIVEPGNSQGEQLRADLAGSDVLRKWVDVSDYTASYFHYQVYQANDPTQDWRWKRLKEDFAKQGYAFKFPLVLVTPPENGAFGDKHNLVFAKSGYNSRPDQLDAELRATIADYSRRVEPQHVAWKAQQPRQFFAGGFHGEELPVTPPAEPQNGAALEQLARAILYRDGKIDALDAPAAEVVSAMGKFLAADRGGPFNVCPPLSPPNVLPVQAPAIPPPAAQPQQPAPQSNFALWATLIAGLLGLGGTNFVGVALGIWALIRAGRQAAGQAVLPQATYDKLHALLEKLDAKTT